MHLCISTTRFIEAASAVRIRDYLTEEVDSEAYGLAVMKWLRANRPTVCDETLCLVYDVAVYRTGDTCFAPTAPADEQDKWFVAVLTGSDLDGGEQIPLADTAEQAHALAVKHLGLEAKFFEPIVEHA